MMGSQKVPGVVVLHNNGRTYGKTYLNTFKVGPLHARVPTDTDTHARHTLAASILPLEGFFLESW